MFSAKPIRANSCDSYADADGCTTGFSDRLITLDCTVFFSWSLSSIFGSPSSSSSRSSLCDIRFADLTVVFAVFPRIYFLLLSLGSLVSSYHSRLSVALQSKLRHQRQTSIDRSLISGFSTRKVTTSCSSLCGPVELAQCYRS